eukprot:1161561-Pelagomonas_calceolata.AAC.4
MELTVEFCRKCRVLRPSRGLPFHKPSEVFGTLQFIVPAIKGWLGMYSSAAGQSVPEGELCV